MTVVRSKPAKVLMPDEIVVVMVGGEPDQLPAKPRITTLKRCLSLLN
jgi:hypothetical protein